MYSNFLNDTHKADYSRILGAMNASIKSVEHTSLAYLVAATYKTNDFINNCITESGGVDKEKLHETIAPYSTAEKAMIRFGLQTYNYHLDDIIFDDVVYSLDDNNKKAVREVLKVRYKI